jgi:hypothetical protein
MVSANEDAKLPLRGNRQMRALAIGGLIAIEDICSLKHTVV